MEKGPYAIIIAPTRELANQVRNAVLVLRGVVWCGVVWRDVVCTMLSVL